MPYIRGLTVINKHVQASVESSKCLSHVCYVHSMRLTWVETFQKLENKNKTKQNKNMWASFKIEFIESYMPSGVTEKKPPVSYSWLLPFIIFLFYICVCAYSFVTNVTGDIFTTSIRINKYNTRSVYCFKISSCFHMNLLRKIHQSKYIIQISVKVFPELPSMND